MNYNELVNSDFCKYLVDEINSVDLSSCSRGELEHLKSLTEEIKESANVLTLEGEYVGYTYHNLGALGTKLDAESAKRLVKATSN